MGRLGTRIAAFGLRPFEGSPERVLTMKLPVLITGVALTLANTFASSQSTSGAAVPGAPSSAAATAAQTNPGVPSQLPAGKPSNDSNKMGIAGPESAADTTAPNAASCETVTSPQERSKCMALAKKVPKRGKAASAASRPAP
jgi:hypothetical protein